MMDNTKGKILKIERSSIHDGEGIRTVIFLKGCPLSCKWCSSPESQECGLTNGYGVEMSIDEVMNEVQKDEMFYYYSNGGITLSGGEVFNQAGFATEILKRAKYLGINTAIETCLYADYKDISKMIKYLNMMYIDLKIINEELHKKYTGKSNSLILSNLKKVCINYSDLKIIIRIPIIPTINDSYENLFNSLEFCDKFDNILLVELLPYHRFGVEMYDKLKIGYSLKKLKVPTDKRMKEIEMKIKEQNFRTKVIIK